jgi:hypothetical protein
MTVYPSFTRALLGIAELRDTAPDERSIQTDIDMTAIRRATESARLPPRDRNVGGNLTTQSADSSA